MASAAAGFGGGMGAGEMCGAATGGIMALGLVYGQDGIDRELTMEKTKKFIGRFSEKNDAVRCVDIIGFNPDEVDAGDIKALLKFGLKGGPKMCKKVVKGAVEMVMEEMV